MLHTLYGKSLNYKAKFFIEYFALELLMNKDNTKCVGALVYNMEDGNYHILKSKNTVIATGGYGRCYFYLLVLILALVMGKCNVFT